VQPSAEITLESMNCGQALSFKLLSSDVSTEADKGDRSLKKCLKVGQGAIGCGIT
jgi:hypothetical protein